MIELMVVIGIVAILSLMMVPGYQDKLIRDQIAEALPLADIVKAPVAAAWTLTQTFPPDNASVGLPAADKIVNNYISSIELKAGAIHITFGNRANGTIRGKVLSLRPATVDDAPVVPVTWVCGYAGPPSKMTVKGPSTLPTTVTRSAAPAISIMRTSANCTGSPCICWVMARRR